MSLVKELVAPRGGGNSAHNGLHMCEGGQAGQVQEQHQEVIPVELWSHCDRY